MNPVQFSEIDFADISKIKVRYEVAPLSFNYNWRILRISFSGNYGHGSEGNNDALYMRAMVDAAVTVFYPDGLIYDFQELSYTWGDQLDKVLFPPECLAGQSEPPPFAITTGSNCEEAIFTLFRDLNFDRDALSWVFNTSSSAADYVVGILRGADSQRFEENRKEKDQRDRDFWDLLGEEVGPEECRHPGCKHKHIGHSVLCRVHHFERYCRHPCPFIEARNNEP